MDGVYHGFTKYEKFKAILLESGKSLKGPWTEYPDFTLAQLRGYEGPSCCQV